MLVQPQIEIALDLPLSHHGPPLLPFVTRYRYASISRFAAEGGRTVSESQDQRNWPRRVRALNDRQTRQQEGVIFLEGIRQVLAAGEHGLAFEAIFTDPTRLRSEVAWQFIDQRQAIGDNVVTMRPADFERISSRDNPIGIAAIAKWSPITLPRLEAVNDGIYLATDEVRDPGNLGTLARSADALGAAGLIIHSGTEPSHPTALRASLGSLFALPVATARSLNELFHWANSNSVAVIGTSAHAPFDVSQTALPSPAIFLLGNEGEGLDAETLDRCDLQITIPMSGEATSLNVAVSGAILLYEYQRRLST